MLKTNTTSGRLRMSYEEFLAWSDENTHAEWVAGEVIIQMPPKHVHQSVVEFLYELLALFVRLLDAGKVRLAPFEMKLPDGSAREPNILFITRENLPRLTEARLDGPADLVIEIISSSTDRTDRDEKFKAYQAAGIREYWIIDPREGKHRADFYTLDASGEYTLFGTEDDERVTSRLLPEFWLRPEWLWQADSLVPLTIFFEMRGISATQAEEIKKLLQGGSD